MSITKIAIIVGASIITVGGTAAVATRDKWWPTKEWENSTVIQPPQDNSRSVISQPVTVTPPSKVSQGNGADGTSGEGLEKKNCDSGENQERSDCTPT